MAESKCSMSGWGVRESYSHYQRGTGPNQENFQILNCPTKAKGVTTQMKAINEYFLNVVFPLLLNTVHAFANFMFNIKRETWQ